MLALGRCHGIDFLCMTQSHLCSCAPFPVQHRPRSELLPALCAMQHLPQLLANIYHHPVGSLPASTAHKLGFTAAGGGAERKAVPQGLSHHKPPAKRKQNMTSHRKMLFIKRIPARTKILALLQCAPVGGRSTAWLPAHLPTGLLAEVGPVLPPGKKVFHKIQGGSAAQSNNLSQPFVN